MIPLNPSWQTSVCGILVLVFGTLAHLGPEDFKPWMVLLAEFAGGAGLILAKGSNVSHAPQPTTAAVVVHADTMSPVSVPTRQIKE